MEQDYTLKIKPWDREKYPGLFTKTELKEQKLMPAPNVKPFAIVERPAKYGGNYDLYSIAETVPYQKSEKQKLAEAIARKLRSEKKKNQKLRKEKLYEVIDYMAGLGKPEPVYETVVIDFETTGIDCQEDEILQVSVIDQDGNPLLNQLCIPFVKQEWKQAERVHGITPEVVSRMPSFLDVAPEVARVLLSAREVIAYNHSFEAAFLSSNGIDSAKLTWGEDPMISYADRYNNGRYAKLSKAAAAFGYVFDPHDALEDVKATLFLYMKLKENAEDKAR